MPKGMVGVRDAVRDIEERKNSGGSGEFRKWFRLDDGESAIVRFLEQGEDVKWAWCHEVPVPGRQFGRWVACRDQDEEGQRIGEACPGCEQETKRKFQGFINLIWRDAPTFKTDAQGRLEKQNGKPIRDGEEDQIAMWQAGVIVFEELDGKDVHYKGLTSRDFRITRRGTGMNTKYAIEPADPDGGAKPMSKADQKLEGEKYDFTEDVTPQPYEDWGKLRKDVQATNERPDVTPVDTSPFMKKA